MKIAKGVIIYAGWFDLIDDARAYISAHKLTQDDVALRRDYTDDGVYVITKREIELCGNQK